MDKTESRSNVCVGCQLNSDQTLGLLFLKGHVRVRLDAERHQLTRSKWILVYQNTPLFEGVQQQKNPPKPSRNAFSDALLMSCFQNFAAGAAKKNRVWNRAKRSFNWSIYSDKRFWEVVCFTDFHAHTRSGKLFWSPSRRPCGMPFPTLCSNHPTQIWPSVVNNRLKSQEPPRSLQQPSQSLWMAMLCGRKRLSESRS